MLCTREAAMKTQWRARAGFGLMSAVLLVTAVSADTLYLRNGRRI
jgi:hypothetical protein